eukprot:14893862-Ditylum_brightwellii.AAC.1
MTQHKEECGEDEEGNPEIIGGIRDDEDSGEECGKEGNVEVGKSKKDASEAPLSKAKGESLTEEACDKMEEKEKKKK